MMQTPARHERTAKQKIGSSKGQPNSKPKSKEAREKRRRIAREMPQRRCLVSAESFPKDQLLRFVVGPDLQVVPDFAGDLPGRGFYVTPQHDMLKKAVKKRLLARAASQGAKQQVTVPDDFDEQVFKQAKWHALRRLGLLRRGGAVVFGLEKAQSALSKGKGGLYLSATNSDSPEIQKLKNLLIRPDQPNLAKKYFQLFSAEEQGESLGRDRLVHIVALQGQQCEALAKALTIVQQLSSDDHSTVVQNVLVEDLSPEAKTEPKDA